MIEATLVRKGCSRTARRFAIACLVLAHGGLPVAVPTNSGSLDPFILDHMRSARMPGLAACIVRDGQIAWAQAYGWADLDRRTPVTPDTVFEIGSVSKPVTATALMQLLDRGLFHLDDPVDSHLPFTVVNPWHTGDRITFRQVLSHVSSIKDKKDTFGALFTWGADSPIPLAEFLPAYFTPGGVSYQKKNFYACRPGSEYHYSSIGYGLVAYLVECLSGEPFEGYCREHLFAPLQMTETTWRIADLDPARVAFPYTYDQTRSRYTRMEFAGHACYPAGSLHTSARQLARFLIAHAQCGECQGVRILEEETEMAMRQPQFPAVATYGLGLANWSLNGVDLIGHGGRLEGSSAEFWFFKDGFAGALVLANGNLEPGATRENEAWYAILGRLLQEAQTTPDPPIERRGGNHV